MQALMRALRPILTAVPLLLLPQQMYAYINVCGLAPGLPCATGGAGGAITYAGAVIMPGLYAIFYAIALIFFFYYAIRLIIESDDENTIAEVKSAYTYAITGSVVVGATSYLIAAVGPTFAGNTLINPPAVNAGLGNVILFMRLMVSAAVTGMIVYQGFRMILLQGQESELEQQKKRFFNGLIGVAVILLAAAIVNAFLPSSGSSLLALEIVGIINFLLELMGALAVLAMIVAGIMLVVSTEEGLKDRAKKALFTTIIVLILVIVSSIIVRFVVNVAGPESGAPVDVTFNI